MVFLLDILHPAVTTLSILPQPPGQSREKGFFFKQSPKVIVVHSPVCLNLPALFQCLLQTFQRIPFSFCKLLDSAICCKVEKSSYIIDNMEPDSFKY